VIGFGKMLNAVCVYWPLRSDKWEGEVGGGMLSAVNNLFHETFFISVSELINGGKYCHLPGSRHNVDQNQSH